MKKIALIVACALMSLNSYAGFWPLPGGGGSSTSLVLQSQCVLPSDAPAVNPAYVSIYSNGYNQVFPSMISETSTNLLLAWGQNESGMTDAGTGRLYFARSYFLGLLSGVTVMATNEPFQNITLYPIAPCLAKGTTAGTLLYFYTASTESTASPWPLSTSNGWARMRRSTDNGATWSASTQAISNTNLHHGAVLTGNWTPQYFTSGSRIVMPFWSGSSTNGTNWYSSLTIESTDNGATWDNVRVVCDGFATNDFDETALVDMGSSNVLALIGGTKISIARSTDAAQTWGSIFSSFTGIGRPSCNRMADGRLIASYRSASTLQQAMRYSTDGGTNWSGEIILDTQSPSRSTYQQGVEISSNLLFLAYCLEPTNVSASVQGFLRGKYIINGIGADPLGFQSRGLTAATFSAASNTFFREQLPLSMHTGSGAVTNTASAPVIGGFACAVATNSSIYLDSIIIGNDTFGSYFTASDMRLSSFTNLQTVTRVITPANSSGLVYAVQDYHRAFMVPSGNSDGTVNAVTISHTNTTAYAEMFSATNTSHYSLSTNRCIQPWIRNLSANPSNNVLWFLKSEVTVWK